MQGYVQRREILIPKPTEGHFGVGFPNKTAISGVVDWDRGVIISAYDIASTKIYTRKLHLIFGSQLFNHPLILSC